MAPNEQQLKIINSTSKKIIVLACPGSGKTSTLVDKIVKNYHDGASLKRLLSVTFTRKAANEMLERISKQIPVSRSEGRNICTLHSFGCRLLFKYKDVVGLKDEYSVAVKADKREIAMDALGTSSLSDDLLDVFLEYVSSIKNGFVSHGDLFTIEQFNAFCKSMIAKNLIDIDDYIYLPVQILKNNDVIRKIVSAQFDYIYVDEYQDINKIQNDFLDLLINEKTNVLYVGDDDQSIYEFRGSNPNFILEKSKPDSGYDVYFLTTNYRSQKTIVDFSKKVLSSLSSNNRREKTIIANKSTSKNKPVRNKPFNSKTDEIDYVVNEIVNLINNSNVEPKEIAVLSRYTSKKNSSGSMNHPELSEICSKLNSRYISASITSSAGSDTSFSKEIKNLNSILLDLASEVITPVSAQLGGQIQIKEKRIKQYAEIYNSDNQSNLDVDAPFNVLMEQIIADGRTITSSEQFQANLSKIAKYYLFIKEQKNNIKNGGTLSNAIANILVFIKENGSLNEIAESIYEYALTYARSAEAEYEDEDVDNKYLGIVKSMEAYLWDQNNIPKDENYVHLLTAHQSKGLQFDVVFVVGLEAGGFPSTSFDVLEDGQTLDNERRLFYVCVTRARELLYLSSTGYAIQGQPSLADKTFIYNVPDTYFDNRINDFNDINFTITDNGSLSRKLEANERIIEQLEDEVYLSHITIKNNVSLVKQLGQELDSAPKSKELEKAKLKISNLEQNVDILMEENKGQSDFIAILQSRNQNLAAREIELRNELASKVKISDIEKQRIEVQLANIQKEKAEILERENKLKEKFDDANAKYEKQKQENEKLVLDNKQLLIKIANLCDSTNKDVKKQAADEKNLANCFESIVELTGDPSVDATMKRIVSKFHKTLIVDKRYPVIKENFESSLACYNALVKKTYSYLNADHADLNSFYTALRCNSFKTNLLNFVKKIIEIMGCTKGNKEVSVYPFLREFCSPSNRSNYYSNLVSNFKKNYRKPISIELINRMKTLYALTIQASHDSDKSDSSFKEYVDRSNKFLNNPGQHYYSVISSFFEFVDLFFDNEELMIQIKVL